MNIRFKLYAMLSRYLPAQSERNEVDVPIDAQTSIQDIIDAHHLPPALCHLVLLNGVYIAPESRATHPLNDGDHLAIWPPVAGG